MSFVFGQGPYGQGSFGGSGAIVSAVSADSFAASAVGYTTTLALDETGDLEIPLRVAKGDEAIQLSLQSKFRFFEGEWFLDLRLGIPYFRSIFVKNPNLPAINGIFRRVILSEPGVVSVSSLSTVYDKKTRAGLINFAASLDDGRSLTAKNEPFIVSP